MDKKKLFFVGLYLIVISALHYLIPKNILSLHIVFRILYFPPIIYVGLSLGRKWALIFSVIVTLLFLPHFLFQKAPLTFHIENTLALIILFTIGILSGMFRDKAKRQIIKTHNSEYVSTKIKEIKRILFYVDHTNLSFVATDWFVQLFKEYKDVEITLFYVMANHDLEDFFETKEEEEKYIKENHNKTIAKLKQITDILIDTGFAENNIASKLIETVKNTRISEEILSELKQNQYDILLVVKHNLTMSQEFLFGDVAVSLVRESPVPVVLIKESSNNL